MRKEVLQLPNPKIAEVGLVMYELSKTLSDSSVFLFFLLDFSFLSVFLFFLMDFHVSCYKFYVLFFFCIFFLK